MRHREKAKNRIELIEQFGDLANTEIIAKAEPRVKELIAKREGLTEVTLMQDNLDEQNKYTQIAKTKFLAYFTIKSFDDANFGELKQSLHNQYTTGNRDVYRTTIEAAIHMADQFKKTKTSKYKKHDKYGKETGMAFYQRYNKNKMNNGNNYGNPKCFCCGSEEHLYGEDCPQYEKLPRNKWHDRSHKGITNNNNGEAKDKAPTTKTKKGKQHFQFMTYEPRIYENDSDSDDEEPPELVSRYNSDYDSDSEN